VEALALIPARGGSKGLPGKNIKPFFGTPLISWSIKSALESEMVTRVVVSTDDPEIAEISRSAGAEIPFLRPAQLAQDETTDLPVFQHALNWLDKNEDYHPDYVVHLRPTSPFRPDGYIDEGIRILVNDPKADSVRSVCIPENNPFKMWQIEEGVLVPLINSGVHEQYNQPRQALPPAYWQTAVLDVVRPNVILDKNSMTGVCILPIFLATKLVTDIDDELSLRYAEEICRCHGKFN
jgi:CMP-N-acetylneuraminic acid synthetase